MPALFTSFRMMYIRLALRTIFFTQGYFFMFVSFSLSLQLLIRCLRVFMINECLKLIPGEKTTDALFSSSLYYFYRIIPSQHE